MDAIASMLLLLYFCLAFPRVATQKCPLNQSSQVKGRFFRNKRVNSSDGILASMTVPTIYACRHVCVLEQCLVLSYTFAGNGANCILFNGNRILDHLIDDANSAVISHLPISCKRNSTVDGEWSAWQNTSDAKIQTRECSNPRPSCNGNFCPGESAREIEELSGLGQLTETGLYWVDISGSIVRLHIQVWRTQVWIYIQRRVDGLVEFNRTWAEYEDGFGDVNGEFWLGNRLIWILNNHYPGKSRLHINFVGRSGSFKQARYLGFFLYDASNFYALDYESFSPYTGEQYPSGAGDYLPWPGTPFSTKDRDEEDYGCASVTQSGWWHSTCQSMADLNGRFKHQDGGHNDGMYWHGMDNDTPLAKVTMLLLLLP